MKFFTAIALSLIVISANASHITPDSVTHPIVLDTSKYEKLIKVLETEAPKPLKLPKLPEQKLGEFKLPGNLPVLPKVVPAAVPLPNVAWFAMAMAMLMGILFMSDRKRLQDKVI